MRKSSWIIWMGCKSNNKYPYKIEEDNIQTHRGEGNMKMEAEIGVMQRKPRNAKNCWQPPAARRETWNGFSPDSWKKSAAALPTLILGL